MIQINKLPASMDENELAETIVDVAFQIHRTWGPGLLESVYEELLMRRLEKRGFFIEQQKSIPFEDEGVKMETGFRVDLMVEKKVIIELKSIEKLHPVHFKVLLTYLRLSGCKLGLLINFGEALLKDGIKRVVNGL
jgi:GxxExxY protein